MTAYNTDIRPDTPRNRDDYSAPHMSDVTPGEDIRSVLINRVAWGAIFAGVAIMLAVQLILNLGGLGIGIATLTPDATGQWSVADLSLGTTIWWTVSGIIATYIGGYAAGRLSGDPIESTAGWHGLTVWAVSLVILTGFILAGAGATMGGMLNTAGINSRGMLNTPIMGTPAAGGPQIGSQTNVPPSVPPAETTAQTAPAQGLGAVTTASAPVSPRSAATAALLTVLALVLGAIAAWFGGRAGCIKPTVTIDRPVLH